MIGIPEQLLLESSMGWLAEEIKLIERMLANSRIEEKFENSFQQLIYFISVFHFSNKQYIPTLFSKIFIFVDVHTNARLENWVLPSSSQIGPVNLNLKS